MPLTPTQTLIMYKDKDRDRDRDKDKDRGRYRDRDKDKNNYRRHYPVNDNGYYDYYTTIYDERNYGGYTYGLGAYQQGYEDGLFTGASDARRGQRYAPEQSHFYSGANHGYSSTFGQRDIYQQAYRDGFLRGYEEGYWNWQRYFSGGTFHRGP